MRTIIDLPDSQIAALRELEQRMNVSRAALVRQAVEHFLGLHLKATDAFGAWKTSPGRVTDALAAQKKLRTEWDR